MEELIRRIVLKLFPHMEQKQQVLQFAKIVAVAINIEDGAVSSLWDPLYCVDIRMMDANFAEYGPVITNVPCPVPGIGNNRGSFGAALTGSVAAVQYAYGDPEHPVVSALYAFDRNLPALKTTEMLWQRDNRNLVKMTESGSLVVTVQGDAVVTIGGNADIQIAGYGEIVATGRLLIKSLTRLILKGPSGVKIL